MLFDVIIFLVNVITINGHAIRVFLIRFLAIVHRIIATGLLVAVEFILTVILFAIEFILAVVLVAIDVEIVPASTSAGCCGC